MAAVSTIHIYGTLTSQFGESDARHYLKYREALMREAHGELATKADITELRANQEKHVAEVKTDQGKQIVSLRTEFKTDIAETKGDLIRWMFLFWIGQVAAVFSLTNFLLPSL